MEQITANAAQMWSNAPIWATVTASSVAATFVAASAYKIGLTSGLLTIAGPPEIDYAATEALIEAEGGKHVRAKDGRIIEYFICGSERADARVLVYCHGSMSTGKMFGTLPKWVAKAKSLNVKVIAITQPGGGYSSIQPGRRIENWPRDDLQPVLAAEGVNGAFATSGASLGTAHALAVAQHFGATRVTGLGLQVPFVSMPFSKELGLSVALPYIPRFTSTSLNTSVLSNLKARFILWMFKDPKPGNRLRKKPNCSDTEAKFADDLDRSGHFRGLGMLYTWASETIRSGVDPRQIKGIENVVVWYGATDKFCPPSHGKWLGEHFRCSERPGALREDPGGHSTLGGPCEEFLDVLFKK